MAARAFSALLLVAVALVVFAGTSHAARRTVSSEELAGITDGIVVNTTAGPVLGIVRAESNAFLGIPYAQPPTGPLRWKSPEAAAEWGPAPVWARSLQAGCPQQCQLPHITCPLNTSEDCLYLNVWAPRVNTLGAPWPVLAFLPGGRYEQGTPNIMLYDGDFFANKTQTVLVTIGSRLGALGYLYSPVVSANVGFQDQQLALQWVQQNIAAFGGNPKLVTLFGQSAGAGATAAHMTTPSSYGLYSSAIVESNPFSLTFASHSMADALASRFLKQLNCQDLDCLQAADVATIVATEVAVENHVSALAPLVGFIPWIPVDDGVVVAANPLEAYEKGAFNKVPVIMGTVSQDALMFIYLGWGKNMTDLLYLATLSDVFLLDAPKVLAEYPSGQHLWDNGPDLRPLLSVLATDYIFYCPTRHALLSIAAQTPTWQYVFDHVLSFSQAWGVNYTFCYDAVCHASELPYVFNSAPAEGYTYTPAEAQMAAQMAYAWSNFAHTHDPNQGPNVLAVQWPTIDSDNLNVLNISTPNTHLETGLRSSYCDFWDKLGYSHGEGVFGAV